jgi:hypothetical protein
MHFRVLSHSPYGVAMVVRLPSPQLDFLDIFATRFRNF